MEKSIHSRRYQRLIIELQAYRKLRKMTQGDLAGKLATTQSQVSKIERCERRIDILEFIDICAAINLHPDEIFHLITRASEVREEDRIK